MIFIIHSHIYARKYFDTVYFLCKVIAELMKKTHWKPRTSTSAFNWLLLKINYDLAYDYGHGYSYVPCVILQGEQKLQAKEPSWIFVEFQAGSSAASWI